MTSAETRTRTRTIRGFATAAIVLGQIVLHDTLYWARVQNFVRSPGRFGSFEIILGSDLVVLAFPLLLGALAVYFVWSRDEVRAKPAMRFVLSTVLALISTGVALLIAFNQWGT